MFSPIFSEILDKAVTKEGIKIIGYEDFMRLKNSGEKVRVFDVLSKDSYREGHIPSTNSFPLDELSDKKINESISKDDSIVVYCAKSACLSSTKAAQKLSSLGYTVLDYDGGLEDWKKHGNDLEKS